MPKTPVRLEHRKIVFVKVESNVIEISEKSIDPGSVPLLVY